jgi:phage shock protein E
MRVHSPLLSPAVVHAAALLTGTAFAEKPRQATKAHIDYPAVLRLSDDVSAYRQSRLIDLETFQRIAHAPNTRILDARSHRAFVEGHIAGAINLPSTDFTAQSWTLCAIVMCGS